MVEVLLVQDVTQVPAVLGRLAQLVLVQRVAGLELASLVVVQRVAGLGLAGLVVVQRGAAGLSVPLAAAVTLGAARFLLLSRGHRAPAGERSYPVAGAGTKVAAKAAK
jgi:hypothetical protein